MADSHQHFPTPPGFHDDVPMIDDSMLDRGRPVDFERGMNAFPPLAIGLIAACLVVFVFQVLGGGLADVQKLIDQGALQQDLVEQGEWWRLLSAAFMHGGPDHLIGNMLMLFVLGMACEHAFGLSQFLVLYVACAAGGSLLSLLGDKPSVGASGAIFGLAGAVIAIFWRYRGRLHLRHRQIGIVLAIWAGYQLLLGFGLMGETVDNRAHLGGLLTGMVCALFLRPAVLAADRTDVEKQPLVRTAGVAAVLVLVGAAVPFLQHLLG